MYVKLSECRKNMYSIRFSFLQKNHAQKWIIRTQNELKPKNVTLKSTTKNRKSHISWWSGILLNGKFFLSAGELKALRSLSKCTWTQYSTGWVPQQKKLYTLGFHFSYNFHTPWDFTLANRGKLEHEQILIGGRKSWAELHGDRKTEPHCSNCDRVRKRKEHPKARSWTFWTTAILDSSSKKLKE